MRIAARHPIGHRPLSGIAGWLALLTALVCALVPLDPGPARATGSAFDPTTTSVVLSPRGPRLGTGGQPAVRPPRPDLPDTAPGTAPFAPASAIIVAPGDENAPAPIAAGQASPLQAPPRAGSIGPRAPPLG